jgi:hypothetical protein
MGQNRNLIIGIVVAVIILCCCCPVITYGLYWLWENGDSLVGTASRVLPVLIG